jgi:hypothetical protein
VNTANVKIGLFILSALLAGFAGIVSATRIGSAYAISGTGYELEVIAMCVVGGTSLYGGRGTIIGTIIGVILLRSIRNGIIVIGVPTSPTTCSWAHHPGRRDGRRSPSAATMGFQPWPHHCRDDRHREAPGPSRRWGAWT